MPSSYHRRKLEYKCRDYLKQLGYVVVKSGRSICPDIVALPLECPSRDGMNRSRKVLVIEVCARNGRASHIRKLRERRITTEDSRGAYRVELWKYEAIKAKSGKVLRFALEREIV